MNDLILRPVSDPYRPVSVALGGRPLRRTCAAPPRGATSRARGAMATWWWAAYAVGALVVPPVAAPGHVRGGTPEWPDWASVELLTDLASRHAGTPFPRWMVGRFLMDALPGVQRRQFSVNYRYKQVSIVDRHRQVFYRVGPWRHFPMGGLDGHSDHVLW